MVFTRAVSGEGAPSSVLRTAPPRAQSDFRSRSRLARSRVATRRAMSCRLGEATALSSCARRANTQHVGAQSLVHDIHGGCARVSMVSFGRDPAPELVGVPRVGSLKVGLSCGFICQECVAVSLDFLLIDQGTRVRLISPSCEFGGACSRRWEPDSDCIESTQRTHLFHGRFHGRDSTLPAIFARRPHDARRKVW